MEPIIFEPRLKFKPRLKFLKFGLRSLFQLINNVLLQLFVHRRFLKKNLIFYLITYFLGLTAQCTCRSFIFSQVQLETVFKFFFMILRKKILNYCCFQVLQTWSKQLQHVLQPYCPCTGQNANSWPIQPSKIQTFVYQKPRYRIVPKIPQPTFLKHRKSFKENSQFSLFKSGVYLFLLFIFYWIN